MKRFATPILIVIAAFIGAAGLVATAPTLSAETPEAVAPAVRVTTVTPAPQRLKVRSQGSVMPRTESALGGGGWAHRVGKRSHGVRRHL